MIFSVSNTDAASLLQLPETGMGYQVIETRLRGEFVFRKVLLLNAEFGLDMDTPYDDLILRKIWQGGLVGANIPAVNFQEIHLITKDLEMNILKDDEDPLSQKGGAIDAPVQFANGSDHYIRLSAFKDDKRIDQVNKRLLPGSFTTAMPDFMTLMVNRQLPGSAPHMYDPLERYALPSILPISWVFNIQPKPNDEFQQGIVQPAFGRQGGGVECYFAKGTSVNTFIPPPAEFT
jgi:hypothetical protein